MPTDGLAAERAARGSSSLIWPWSSNYQLDLEVGRQLGARRSCRRPVDGDGDAARGRPPRNSVVSWLSKSYRAPPSPLTLTSNAPTLEVDLALQAQLALELRALVGVVAEVVDDVLDGVGHQAARPGEDRQVDVRA